MTVTPAELRGAAEMSGESLSRKLLLAAADEIEQLRGEAGHYFEVIISAYNRLNEGSVEAAQRWLQREVQRADNLGGNAHF